MISIHTIRTVAKFETRTLLRSWFFRIFAGLSILSIGIFNIAAFVEGSNSPWIFRALPAAIPYANLIILNLGQAIVAIFLASEFLKQDSKNDSIEVIYARSMTNSEYILGKSFGIITVFVILNVLILLMGIGFSFLSNESSQSVLQLLYYPLLISIPTLVFILGLAFFFMTILKNQAITFIILLGYIALTIFYLNTKFYHIFDYIAYQVPMMNSTIGGFGNLTEVIIHRGIYFFLGIGFIFFTISKLNRLPQSKHLVSLPIYLALLAFLCGGGLIWKYIDIKVDNDEFRHKMISLNNKYLSYPKAEIRDCHIDLNHLGEKISAVSKLKLYNSSNSELDTLLFSLNPSLKITSITENNKKLEFKRETHLLKIALSNKLNKAKYIELAISYEGSIDERTHFLDLNPKLEEDNFSAVMFRVRKRFSYLQNNFVCLTNEALWYPISGVGFASLNPVLHSPDFTNFKLKVHTKNNLTPISQGKLTTISDSIFEFQPESALPKISLLIGDYQQYSTTVDSIEYSIYSIKGNQFFLQHFDSIQDSLPSLIRELKNEYETKLDLEYPFKRFALAEVPIQFALDKHIWSISSDAVQPEIIFYPEKGVLMEETDFKKRKKRFETRMKRDNEEVSDEELQSRIFKRFVRGNLMPPATEWYQFDNIDRNTYSPFPNYFGFSTQLSSTEYPALNLALGVYLKEKNVTSQSYSRWRFDGISKEERINLELKKASLQDITRTGLKPSNKNEEQIYLNDILQAKGIHLFSLLKARYGEEKFNSLIKSYIEKNKHQKFSFTDFDSLLSLNCGKSIKKDVKSWYTTNKLPGFLIKDLQTYKVKDGDHIKYQIRYKISNPESSDGIVTVSVEVNGQNGRRNRRNQGNSKPAFSKSIFIPANSAREVGFVFPTQPSRMNISTHISENLPNSLVYDFSTFSETKQTKFFNDVKDCEAFEGILADNEFVVDNEDKGFEYVQISNKSYLKQWLDDKRVSTHEYSRLRTWNPPNEWKSVLRSGFFGKYVRSAFFTKSGQGDRSATWKAELKKGAYYDVFCHIEKVKGYSRRRQQKKTDYNFKIYHESGFDEINKSDQELENGWNYLGTYFITPETSKVELNNKSKGAFLFADAIKWIENK
jgi:ABC-type transport system involved in multi-copper enzyme maturation permease subunit